MEVKMTPDETREKIPESAPDASLYAYVTPGTVLPGTKVVSDAIDRTVLPLLPPYQDVPPDCRAVWFEIYKELVKGR
jgi:hypothetical protein